MAQMGISKDAIFVGLTSEMYISTYVCEGWVGFLCHMKSCSTLQYYSHVRIEVTYLPGITTSTQLP